MAKHEIRILFILLISIITFKTKAQLIKNQQIIGWRGTEDIKLKSFPNKDKSLNCVVLTSPDTILANIYNAKLEVVNSFKIKNHKSEFSSDYVIGGFFTDSIISIVLKNDNDAYLIKLNINFKNNEIKQETVSFNKNETNYALTINAGDKCYCVCTGRKTPFLNILTLSDGNKNKETFFELNKGLGTNLSDKEMLKELCIKAEVGRNYKISYIDADIATLPVNAQATNKLYLKSDTLILTTDNNFNKTRIFKLNLKNGTTKYDTINYQIARNKLADKLFTGGNSIITGNMLYHLFVNIEQLTFTATNLTSVMLNVN